MEVKHYKKYSETTLMNRVNVNNYLTLDKPFSCPCKGHCRPKLEVFQNEKLLGYIKEPNEFCCDPVFEIYNNSNQLIYKYYTDISKDFGNCNECIGNVCTFFIDFPLEATPEEKILLIMGVILMDYRYYGA